jgi:hypothetical protein
MRTCSEGGRVTGHPRWCDPDHCTVERGAGLHRSRSSAVCGAESGPDIQVSLWQGAAPAGEHADTYVELMIGDGLHVQIDLERGRALQLALILRSLCDMSRSEGERR